METLPTTCHTIHGCHSYCVHPRTIHRWRPWLPFPLSLSKYPWMAQLLSIHGWTPCLPPVKVSTHHLLSNYPWMDTLPITFCQTIHGCYSYCVHPWTIHRWTPFPPPSVKVSVDAIVTVPSMGHPWMG